MQSALIVNLVCVAVLAFCGIAGCAERDDRFLRLSDFAMAEVRELPNPVDRLGRVLRLARLRSWRGTSASALAARDDARRILNDPSAAEMGIEPRLAGWISLSELARIDHAVAEGESACREAQTLLLTVAPPAERVKYVQSLAHEVAEWQGMAAAVRICREAADWAAEMGELRKRRGAYIALAGQLVHYNAVDAAAEVIRRDEDRTWRADSFTLLCGGNFVSAQQASLGFSPMSAKPAEGATYDSDASFSWMALDFESYFKSR